LGQTNGNILVLSDEQVAEQLKQLTGGVSLTHRREPYSALEELARQPYAVVLVAEGYPDLPALARAVHRLDPATRVYALCSPAGEAELRSVGAEDLDDYFIFPPSPEELQRIVQHGQEGVYEPVVAAEEAAELPAGEVAELIDSAGSLETLTQRLGELVGRWANCPVQWADAPGQARGGEPLLLLDSDEGPKVLLGREDLEIDPALRARLRALQSLLAPLAAQARRIDALRRLAITDFLTGAYNRRYFYHFGDQLIQRARAEKFRVTLLLYDIDDFKRYNDTYGHAAGDEILVQTAALMRQITREHDIVARIGGDEFAVLFWDAEPPRKPDSKHPQTAAVLAERFVQALGTLEFPSLGPEATGVLTISGGLATYPWDGQSLRDLLRHADRALRRAKRSGKSAIYLVGQADRKGEQGAS